MNSTKVIGKLFTSRQKATDLYATQAEAIQERVFQKLIQTAAPTERNMITHESETIQTSSAYRYKPMKKSKVM